MKEIEIYDQIPTILTKDHMWAQLTEPKIMPGAIIILPDDAILIFPPNTTTAGTDLVAPDHVDTLNVANPPEDRI